MFQKITQTPLTDAPNSMTHSKTNKIAGRAIFDLTRTNRAPLTGASMTHSKTDKNGGGQKFGTKGRYGSTLKTHPTWQASPLAPFSLQACPKYRDPSFVINAEAESRCMLGNVMGAVILGQDGEGCCSVLDDYASKTDVDRIGGMRDLKIAAVKICCQNASLPVLAQPQGFLHVLPPQLVQRHKV